MRNMKTFGNLSIGVTINTIHNYPAFYILPILRVGSILDDQKQTVKLYQLDWLLLRFFINIRK